MDLLKWSQKYMVMKFDVCEGEVCGGYLWQNFPVDFLHHILHTEVRNNQRNLSPSAHSLGNVV